MLSIHEALERVLESVPGVRSETVALADAHGRVLAQQVRSPMDTPPWDNSAMDGYAVRSADIPTDGSDVVLRLNEVVGAGHVASCSVLPGTATGIMTGAPMPEGADSVIMVEYSDGSLEGHVTLRGPLTHGQHVRRRGEDVARGSMVAAPGDLLTPGRLGQLASLGFAEVEVARRPRVGVLSSGDEVIDPGTPLGPGQIYSSNNAALCGLVLSAGAIAVDYGNAPDDLEEIRRRLARAAEQCDLVVTTGGVSVGAYDHMKQVFEELAGEDLSFWKVRMKPGKPLAFGLVRGASGQTPLFGLPGNPVSCMVNFLQFVRPWVRRAMGDPRPFLPVVDATMAEDIRVKPGRPSLVRVELTMRDGVLCASRAGNQSSGAVSSMARAHGLLLIPPEEPGFLRGDSGRVQLIETGFFASESPEYPW